MRYRTACSDLATFAENLLRSEVADALKGGYPSALQVAKGPSREVVSQSFFGDFSSP